MTSTCNGTPLASSQRHAGVWCSRPEIVNTNNRIAPSVDFDSQDRHWGTLQNTQTAERSYERQWAVTLLNRVMARLQREMERSGKSQQFQLKDFPGGTETKTYAGIAPAAGLSGSAVRMAASRMRARYRELLRDEISQTLSAEDDIDDESDERQ